MEKYKKGEKYWVNFGYEIKEVLITGIYCNKNIIEFKVPLYGGKVNFLTRIFFYIKLTKTINVFEKQYIIKFAGVNKIIK